MRRIPFLGSLDLLENWRVKLASILIAILFWFAVVILPQLRNKRVNARQVVIGMERRKRNDISSSCE